MCRFLKISKSTYYFLINKEGNKKKNDIYDQAVIITFKEIKCGYGTRILKVILEKEEIYLSRIKIRKIMNKHNFISKFTILKFKNHKNNNVNDDQIINIVNRQFNNGVENEVIVSDLTYDKVSGKCNYIC